MKVLSTDAELTFDRILRDIEILQIDKVAELLSKATYRKNGNDQHKTTRSDRVLSDLPPRPMPASLSSLSLVKAATSVVILPPNMLLMRSRTSRFARGESNLIVS